MNTKNNLNKKWLSPKIIFKVFVFFVLLLYIQFGYLSLSSSIYGINMDKFAANRNTTSKVLTAERGKILDVEGNALAIDVTSYTVLAYLDESRTGSSKTPLHVVDIESTAKALAPLINMTEEYIASLLSNGKKNKLYQVELGPGGRNITELTKEAISDLNLPGIDFIESRKRSYPNGNFASYTIGYAKKNNVTETDINGNEVEKERIVGELGIEAKYDDLLKGSDGYTSYQRDRFGYKIPDTPETTVEPKDGDNIYLTINSNIQRFIEEEIKESETLYDPEWMMITVMDAKTGDILGTSSSPSFDPNVLDIENYESPLVTYQYEPGSTMKIYTYMCAMENGKYVGDQTYLSGAYQFEQNVVNDWNKYGWGYITYDLGFQYSSNVAVANILNNFIGKKELKECFNKYGFGTKTNIELPREMEGKIAFNYPVEVATAGFGQGINITAIQQLRALTMIANDGKMVTPHIVDKIVNPKTNKTVYESKLDISEQIISTETIEYIKKLMHNAMYGTEEGTAGWRYGIEGFDLIGKTGTSQIFDNASGSYLKGANNYIFSFAGMFPASDPEVIIYAALKQPKSRAGLALVDAVRPVMQNVAKYLNIFDESTEDKKDNTIVPSVINQKTEAVKEQLQDKGLNVIIIGDGDKIIDQYPKKGVTLTSNDTVFLKTNGINYDMPDLLGLSRKDAVNFANIMGVNYEINGYGYVISQSLKENEKIVFDTPIVFELKTPFDVEKKQDVNIEETNQ